MITSTSNQHIAHLHALHSPKGRREEQAWLIEGPHVLEAAFDAGIVPQLIIYDPKCLGQDAVGQRLVERLLEARAGGAEVFEAATAAVDRASETRTPQGVVAAVSLAEVTPDKVRQRRRGRLRPLVVVLDAISDPGNLGSILRSALAADVDEVLLTPGCADPLAPKVVRAGSGAHFHLPVRVDLDWERIRQLLYGAPAALQIVATDSRATRTYDSFDLTQRTGLLIGNETHGISAKARHLATHTASIPMWNKVESLNAAIAASVILFEAARQRRLAEATIATIEE